MVSPVSLCDVGYFFEGGQGILLLLLFLIIAFSLFMIHYHDHDHGIMVMITGVHCRMVDDSL